MKLLVVAFLWVGVSYALPFAVLLLAFAIVHVAATWLGWAKSLQTGSHKRIPFAPTIAGALVGTFVISFLLDDPSTTNATSASAPAENDRRTRREGSRQKTKAATQIMGDVGWCLDAASRLLK